MQKTAKNKILTFFSALQKELIKKGQENQLEQKELKEMVDKLQNQLSSRDVELRSKEIELHRRQNSLDEERRKFETEKEITLAKLKEDQVRLQVKPNTLFNLSFLLLLLFASKLLEMGK